MWPLIAIGVSTLLQFVAAALAIRLFWITRTGRAWAIIAVAVTLMAVRRMITFVEVARQTTEFTGWSETLVALVISILLVVGMAGIAPVFRALEAAERESRSRQLKLSLLLGNLPGMAYRCQNDPQWTMEFVSPGCQGLTGYAADDLIANRRLSYADLIHPDDRGEVERLVDEGVRRSEPFRLVYRIRRADGAERWVWEQGVGVANADGQAEFLEGFIIDITAQREAEQVLRAAQHQLEEAVAARTHELGQANAELQRQIAEREAVQGRLREEQQRLRTMLNRHEAERQLIAYEIHDGLVQQLTGALLNFQAVGNCDADSPGDVRQIYERGVRALVEGIAEARRLIGGLRPPVLDEAGVIAALEDLVASAGAEHECRINFEHRVAFERLEPLQETAIFRIVQESLTNALRYSGSPTVDIVLRQDGSTLHMEVADAGCGFNPHDVPPNHFGLQGIRERVDLLGGQFTLTTAPGQGTRITASVPLLPVPPAPTNTPSESHQT